MTVFADIQPLFVEFAGVADPKLTATVVLTPVHAFRIKKISASPGKWIKMELKEIKTGGKRGYEIRVTNTCSTAMQYFESITVSTDSRERPTLYIPVHAKLKGPAAAKATGAKGKPAKK